MKVCSKCRIDKPKGEFSKRKDGKDGLMAQCKQCKSIVVKKYNKTIGGKKALREAYKKYGQTSKGRNKIRNCANRLKKLVLSYYSLFEFPKCSDPGCGVTDPDMLCIDHINGGGAKHRKEIGGGQKIYRWLKKNGFPDGYQVLCANHNLKKSIQCLSEPIDYPEDYGLKSMSTGSVPVPLASPAYYAWLYPKMAEVAKRLGYALTLHGSLSRDFDVVAVPWVEEAADADVLADTLREELGGFYATNDFPGVKPHGRRTYSIHLGGGPYIDLSVMLRT